MATCKTWREMVEKAEHYLAIGQTDLYLDRDDTDPPWDYVVRVDCGGMVRNGISVSCTFIAEHPCGLTLKWWGDMEDRDANGRDGFKVDTAGVTRTMGLLPEKARPGYVEFLRAAADAIKQRADDALGFAQAQYAQERLLRLLVEAR